jgi:hypothetical protein
MKYEPLFKYQAARLFGMDDASSMNHRAPLWNRCWRLHINQRWLPRCHHPSIIEKRKTTMASKDDNKHKYADITEAEAEDALLRKQKMIGDDNSGDSSLTDDYSLEPE